jgi:flagellar biosynthetic protein FliQ
MEDGVVMDIFREAVIAALYVAAPVLIVGLVAGLLIGLLQALTQIQDQTVAFVPKLLAMIIVLTLCLPWLLQVMSDYSINLIESIPQMLMGGNG